jgi:hypothetical protein
LAQTALQHKKDPGKETTMKNSSLGAAIAPAGAVRRAIRAVPGIPAGGDPSPPVARGGGMRGAKAYGPGFPAAASFLFNHP